MKELDPTCFRIGAQENLDALAQDGHLYESDGEYHQLTDIEDMMDKQRLVYLVTCPIGKHDM